MSQNNSNNPFTDLFAGSDFARLFGTCRSGPFDLGTLLETQRKNAQAIAEANKIAAGNLQAIAQRQTEIISQIVEDNSALAKEMMTEGTPEEKIARNAKMFKTIYERMVGNLRDMSDIIGKTNDEASAVINRRVAATMNEIQDSLEKTAKKKAA